MITLFEHNQIVYETAVAIRHETGKAVDYYQEHGNLRGSLKYVSANEGIHVADVDGVVLFRPTVSPIIYKQQIGCALSAGSAKTPVIFDVVYRLNAWK